MDQKSVRPQWLWFPVERPLGSDLRTVFLELRSKLGTSCDVVLMSHPIEVADSQLDQLITPADVKVADMRIFSISRRCSDLGGHEMLPLSLPATLFEEQPEPLLARCKHCGQRAMVRVEVQMEMVEWLEVENSDG